MKPNEFVRNYLPYALKLEKERGISAVAILSQAAVESAWGNAAPGFMFFGVKDTDGLNGNEQLLITTEYLTRADAKFPVVLSVTKTANKLYKYVVKDYFRKYTSPYESFADHAQFFFKNNRYSKALLVRQNPYLFIDEVAKAGYATDPNYAKLLRQVAYSIEIIIKQNEKR